MLRSLHVEHYALIDSLDVTFPEGLVIITGETGAGKSILLGALSLLTGARADASCVAEGASGCVVEGEFEIADKSLESVFEESGLDWNGGDIVIRRVVSASGRSRAFVCDCPVQLQFLSDIASHIVDIHGQHQSLRLADKAWQLRVLDLYAGNADLLARTGASWRRLKDLERSREEASDRLALLRRDEDYNRSRFERLDKAAVREGELDSLEAEQKVLANAEEIRSGLSAAWNSLENPGGTGVAESLKEARRSLEKISTYVPSAAGLAGRLDSARIEIEDILSEISALSEPVDVSPQRLQDVDDRIALIYDLFRSYGCRTEAELLAEKERLSEALFDTSGLEERIEALRLEADGERKSYDALCASLREARAAAAPLLASDIQQSLRFLELDRAVFGAALTDSADGPQGRDAVQFLFSSTGRTPEDVGKCASGGEISRIALCLKAVMARYTGMPTLVFDEIDTGVSGSAAAAMGSMICSMGRDMQVLAITHLPQVAAKGDAHYRVVKSETSDGRIASTVETLDTERRVLELARLLSGSEVTPEAVANARKLISNG